MSEAIHPAITKSTVLKKQADGITTRRSIYAAGAGLIPIPLLDLTTLLGVQVIMIKDIADVYGVTQDYKDQIKNLIPLVVGGLATAGVVSSFKAIPFVGTAVGMFTAPITGAASTYALGKVFTKHFDQGGTLLDFDPKTSREQFHKEYVEGLKLIETKEAGTTTGEDDKAAAKTKAKAKTKAAKAKAEENNDLRDLLEKISNKVDALEKKVG